jgi:trans-aconitate methyltransferase
MHDNRSYKGPRPDLVSQLRAPFRVLDVGCNNGAVARAIKQRYPDALVWGMDINEQAINEARSILEMGWALDLDLANLGEVLKGYQFDHIIAGDVLEHTVHFQRITGALYAHLSPGGRMIISVPNYGHWHTIWVFLTRKWQRNERGIFDKTHRTVIMYRNLPEFKAECPGATLRLVERKFRFFETNRFWKLNMVVTWLLCPIMIIPYFRDWLTHSYLLVMSKPDAQV